MHLHQLIYRSETSRRMNEEEARREIASIIEISEPRNLADRLSGILTLAGNAFLQVLEGPSAAVEDTFERISRDLRHRRLQVLEFTPVSERAFAAWPMRQITSTGELIRLCSDAEPPGARISQTTAAAVVRTMRSILNGQHL